MAHSFEIREARRTDPAGKTHTWFEVLELFIFRGIRRRVTRMTEPFRTREEAERWIAAQLA